MRAIIAAALVAFASGSLAQEKSNTLANRYQSAQDIRTLVEAAIPFFSDISKACRKVAPLVPELEANYGHDSARDEAYVSITSCCSVISQVDILNLGNALAQIASPTRSEIINFVFSSASAPIHSAIEDQLGDARASVSGHCKKVPVLATILPGRTP